MSKIFVLSIMVGGVTGVQPVSKDGLHPPHNAPSRPVMRSVSPNGGVESPPTDMLAARKKGKKTRTGKGRKTHKGKNTREEGGAVVRASILPDGGVRSLPDTDPVNAAKTRGESLYNIEEQPLMYESRFWQYGLGSVRAASQKQREPQDIRPAVVGFKDAICSTELGAWTLPSMVDLHDSACIPVDHRDATKESFALAQATNAASQDMSMSFQCSGDESSIQMVLHVGSECSGHEPRVRMPSSPYTKLRVTISDVDFASMREGKCIPAMNFDNSQIEYIMVTNTESIAAWPMCTTDVARTLMWLAIGGAGSFLLSLCSLCGYWLYAERLKKLVSAKNEEEVKYWAGQLDQWDQGKGKLQGAHMYETFDVVANEEDAHLGFQHNAFFAEDTFKVMVESVEEVSWAQAQQLAVGDEVFMAEGSRVDGMDEEGFENMMSRRPLNLTIRRVKTFGSDKAKGTLTGKMSYTKVPEWQPKEQERVFLFVFPMMPGDVNPSLPVARKLVRQGHSVFYLSPDYRAAVEDTGAKFLDATKYYDLYKEGRKTEAFGAANQLKQELQLSESDGEYMVRVKIANIELEKKLPGVLNAIRETKATALVYDPVLCREAAIASEISKLPSVALLTFAGHGAWAELVESKLKNDLPAIHDEKARIKAFEAASMNMWNQSATQRINETYKGQMKPLDGRFTGGRLDPIPDICVVTTTETSKVAETPDLVGSSKVHYVGPLLDVAGALRAGGPASKDGWKEVEAKMDEKTQKGKVIFVSMGTVTTVDGPLGWQGKPDSALTGEQLCHAVWGGAMDALGGKKGNVILMTVGKDSSGNPRPLAIGDQAPDNSYLSPSMPQVDILTKGVDLFITHGGQNSFVESIIAQTPMLVVPTVGDQIVNADKAVEMGIGDMVSRPPPSAGDPAAAAAKYRKKVCGKILGMLEETQYKKYKAAAVEASNQYRGGGADCVVDVLEGLPLVSTREDF